MAIATRGNPTPPRASAETVVPRRPRRWTGPGWAVVGVGLVAPLVCTRDGLSADGSRWAVFAAAVVAWVCASRAAARPATLTRARSTSRPRTARCPPRWRDASKRLGKQVIALAGTLGPGARRNHDAGIDADAGSWPPGTTAEAVDQAATLLTDATERALRLVLVGAALSRC